MPSKWSWLTQCCGSKSATDSAPTSPTDTKPKPKPDGNFDNIPHSPEPDVVDDEERVVVPEPVQPPEKPEIDDVEPGGDGTMVLKDESNTRMGRVNLTLEARTNPKEKPSAKRPTVAPGSLWNDPDFSRGDAFKWQINVDWKRPKDIVDDPALVTDGVTRFDIGQGNAGTCWFLCNIAAIADKPDIFKQIVPDDAYNIGTPEYDGVFHAVFWRCGQWVDIYVDDHLPIVPRTDNVLWGVQSRNDSREMWPALLEKAFAKFEGSYINADGGWSGDAFISLTGGVVENIDLKQVPATDLYNRLKVALNGGAVVTAGISQEMDRKMGLIGKHAYTLTAVATVVPMNTRSQVPLLRLRNPWGKYDGEWKGAYGDYGPGASAWDNISSETKEKLNLEFKADGEFWMTLYDFYKYFDSLEISNLTPDFDLDGDGDNLDMVTNIHGEWLGPTAAGGSLPDKFNNQKFQFTVPDTKVESDGKVPFVLQMMEHRNNRNDPNRLYVRADLYKVDKHYDRTKPCLVLEEITNYTTYMQAISLTYRYRLEPGEYLILPTTLKSFQQGEFMLRLFSTVAIDAKQIKGDVAVYLRQFPLTNEINGENVMCSQLQHFHGNWRSGVNAGGQIKYKTHQNNPQYSLNIKGSDQIPLLVSLKQEVTKNRLPIGFSIYSTDKLVSSPLDTNYLNKHFNTRRLSDINGGTIFIVSYEGASVFLLKPGNYVIIPFLNYANDEASYVLTLGTTADAEITEIIEMNIAE